jgi:hypothetical protein
MGRKGGWSDRRKMRIPERDQSDQRNYELPRSMWDQIVMILFAHALQNK